MSTRPILVTGSHRSGTTWVGRVLSAAGGVAHIHEPMNPVNRLSWLGSPPRCWFLHLDDHNAAEHRTAFDRMLSLRPPLAVHLRTVRSVRNLAANVREFGQVVRWRTGRARPLVKDPIALFGAEWLARTYDMHVVVLVRHPAAFAGSLKRNGWTFDFANFAGQPTLMEGYLEPFADDIMAAAAAHQPDIIEQAILLWRCINGVVARLRHEHPDWLIVRYEDLASDPGAGAKTLYAATRLPWTARSAARVRSLSSSDNPSEAAVKRTRDVRRDSAEARWTWQRRLTPEESSRVRTGTADVAAHFYSDRDWAR